MMIIIALIFHKLGHYIPIWITRRKVKDIRNHFKWEQVLFEMSGTIMNFVLAFLIILIITLNSKEKYLLNDKVIYGIECSDVAKNMGFKDGDKIISINNKRVIRFSDILKTILLESEDVKVVIQRSGNESIVNITDEDKISIIESNTYSHFMPKLRPDSISGRTIDQLDYEESRKGINDAFELFLTSIKIISSYFLPRQSQYNSMGGFLTINVSDFKGAFFLLSHSSILIGLLNLIPLPGLDLGNTIIAFIERNRKRKFNKRKVRIIRIASVSLLIVFLIAIIYMN